MESLGASLAQATTGGLTVALCGTLGAGKTTLTRGFLRALGHTGTVKSPTFTVIEPYDLARGALYHFDLYRLNDPTELELLGLRDYFSPGAICLVEWPERGDGVLPALDLRVEIHYCDQGRSVDIQATTPQGSNLVETLSALLHKSNDTTQPSTPHN